ncbi:hypothetical protein [Flavobacterium sp. T12S277]|uniref:hypothetical protein n=1 Tax=Flavobacterium sp. T12S277 TaxID=3402752 RepID=UPI003ADEE14C
MKKIIILIITLINSIGYTQDIPLKKWYSDTQFDLIIHKRAKYSYSYLGADTEKHTVWDEQLNVKKPAIGFTYTYNYMLFKKLSIGILTGYKNYTSPDFSILELGGILKFFFVDTKNIYTYASLSNQFSLNKNQFRNGTNARIGIGLPIIKGDSFSLSINLFKEQQFLRLDDAKPLFNYNHETPGDLIYSSYGLSAGIKF